MDTIINKKQKYRLLLLVKLVCDHHPTCVS